MMGNKIIRTAALLAICLITFTGAGQNIPTQTIRGSVADKISQGPVSGANVYIENTEPLIGTMTDEDGKFRLEEVPVGRYTLVIRHVSYTPYIISGLEVNAGKEVILQIEMIETLRKMKEVVITADQPERSTLERLNPVSTRLITVEQTNRYAATFMDPARLATSFPGVNTFNDQSNHICIRGHSPNNLNWLLEGAEIVNPNHTANAGTVSDRITANGGGTIIFSTQLLGNSLFMTGAFPAKYGNALSGIFDMSFRDGNNENREYTVQAGLIGLDFAAEGPFSKKGNSSYLVNYRYSTVGILTALGMDLGDEAINYQDLSFNLSFPTPNAGKFTIFGIGGISSNIFEAERDTSTWEFRKDRYDIRFHSKMGAIGATHTYSLTSNSHIRSVIATSAVEHKRRGIYLDDQLNEDSREQDDYYKLTTSFHSTLNHRMNIRNHLQTGISVNNYNYQLHSNRSLPGQNQSSLVDASGSTWLVQPYIQWRHFLRHNITINGGVHIAYLSLNASTSLEPRATMKWTVNPQHSFSLAYGLHSQMQLLGTYFSALETAEGTIVHPNKELDFTKAHHYILNYTNRMIPSVTIQTELYYQDLFNVPISTDPSSSFSVLNLMEGYVTDSLVNHGSGANYGVELSISRSLKQGYYFLVSSTLYESKYTGADGIQRDTRFNGNYNLTVSGGREFERQKEDKNRVIAINIRTIYQGGFRRTPIDVEASELSGTTVYDGDQAYSIRRQDYFRIDLRFSHKRNKPQYTRVIAIDIQNVTNRQNIAFQYFDPQQESIVTKYQLGIIPLISYRLEF